MSKTLPPIGTVISLIGIVASASAQTGRNKPLDAIPRRGWETEAWTGDEKPYQGIRLAADKVFVQGHAPTDLAERYKMLAAKHPEDPQAQFRWAYAEYREAKIGHFSHLEKLNGLGEALARAMSPHTFEYDRLRFLVDAKVQHRYNLKTIGRRLVRHDPKDGEIKYYLISLLDVANSSAEKQEAMSYAQELTLLQPKRPSVYTALGGVYFRSWFRHHDKADGDKAIAAYRKYLQLTPPNDPWRPRIERYIKHIQAEQAQRTQKRG